MEPQDRESERIQEAILALEQQRATLGAATVEAAVLALREKLSRLREPLPATDKRKQVTVLFADVTDFTRLSESLDAEEITELLNLLWQRIDRIILQRGGRIDKHMGDAVMAFWGADRAREDDAEQAVRAALEIKAAVQELRPHLKTPIPLNLSIGISTGPVVLGTLSTTGEYTAIGSTVNLAYRLEGVAPAGSILISHSTYQHVRGLFQCHALPPLELKGFAEPVPAYQVFETPSQTQQYEARGIEGITPRMIGRQAELQQLQAAYHATLDEQRARVMAITGEAGIGKSRLVQEFEQWAAELLSPPLFLKGRARQETQPLPYALLRNMLSRRFSIYENDRPATVRSKLEQGLGEFQPDPALAVQQAHYIGGLLGFSIGESPYLERLTNDPPQLYHRATQALLELLQAHGRRGALLLVLEDLHWADSSSLQLLHRLIPALAETPTFILSVVRTNGEHEAFPLQLTSVPVQQLPLRPLDEQESQRLIAAILINMPAVPPALADLIISKAQGNPFYIEELIQGLIEARIILRNAPYWEIDRARLISLDVPQTLTGLLQARFDALPRPMQNVLQRAAVIGPQFWTAAVEALAAEDDEGARVDCGEQLELLIQRGLLVRHTSSTFVGTQEYAFRHPLMHEVVYRGTLNRLRRLYHARAARWLSSHSEERAGELTGLIAEHLLNADLRTEAVAALLQAGQQAAARFANEQALGYFIRALALTDEADLAQRYALHLELEAVYEITSDSRAQQQTLTTLETLAEALDDDRCRLEVSLRQAVFATATSDYPAAITAARHAIMLARALALPCQEAEGYLRWGSALLRQGNYPQAQQQLEHAYAMLEALDERSIECGEATAHQKQRGLADTLRALGTVYWYQGQYPEARTCYETAMRYYRELHYTRGEAHCLNNLGVLVSDSHPEEALAFHQQALVKYREIGNRSGEARALSNIAFLLVTRGDLDTARTAYLQTLELRRAAKDWAGETVVLSNLGEIALMQGRYEEARAFFEQSRQINHEIGNRQGEGGNLGNLGATAFWRGDYATARQLLEQALASSNELGLRRAECDNLLVLCQLFHETGDLASARARGEEALRLTREVGYRYTEAAVLSELGYISYEERNLEAARAAFQEALDIQRQIGQYHLTLDSRAALALLALEQERSPEALTAVRQEVEDIWEVLKSQQLAAVAQAPRIYLTCHRLLEALGDERAETPLEQAYQLLQDRAAGLPDTADRQLFLQAGCTNRAIVAAWRAKHL